MSTLEKQPTLKEEFYKFFELRNRIKDSSPMGGAYSEFLRLEHELGNIALDKETFFNVMEEAYNNYRELEIKSGEQGEELMKTRRQYTSLLNLVWEMKKAKDKLVLGEEEYKRNIAELDTKMEDILKNDNRPEYPFFKKKDD